MAERFGERREEVVRRDDVEGERSGERGRFEDGQAECESREGEANGRGGCVWRRKEVLRVM